MAVISNKLGKGLHEAAGQGRTLNIFGNDFNPVVPDDTFGQWDAGNFPLEIVDESAAYDFATLTPAHEVVTCLTYITDIPGNLTFFIKHEWYDANNNLIHTFGPFQYNTGAGPGWQVWQYSFVGYADWELNDAGNCKCVITITGDIVDSEDKNFTTSNVIDAETLKHESAYIWLEGDYLHYTDYWGWEHIIPKVLRLAGSDTPGYMWIENIVAPLKHAIFYIDEDDDKRRTREGKEDNYLPASGENPGYIWIQDGYHGNFISFIDQDGKKYVVADGIRADF